MPVGNEAVPLGDARPDPSWDEERLAVYAKGELANSHEAERQARGETLTTAEAIYGEDINENARPDSYFDPDAEEEVEEPQLAS